jgi:hypothetical protein
MNKMDLSLFKIIDEYKYIDQVQEYLRNDDNTRNDRGLLKKLIHGWNKRYSITLEDHGINDRWLIVLILLNYFPDELDLMSNMILYEKVINIVNYIKNDDYPDDFCKKIITVKLLYDKWKKDDWNVNIKLIIGLYLQYNIVIENCENNIYGNIDKDLINLWKIYRDELFKMLKEISPGRYNHHIECYKSIYNNSEYLDVIEKNIKDEIYNEYWTNIKLRYKYPYQGNIEPILKSIVNDYNDIRNRLCELMEIEFDDIVVNDLNELNIIWVLIKDVKKFDSPYMDKLYDNIYVRWNSHDDNISFIDIIRLIYDRMEIIISLLNKKDV